MNSLAKELNSIELIPAWKYKCVLALNTSMDLERNALTLYWNKTLRCNWQRNIG